MSKYGLVIDISRCTACHCCFTACKDEYWDNDFPPYTAAQPRFGQFWMNIKKNERGKFPYVKAAYMPLPCMQCNSPSCVEAAENDAVYRRDDGIVVIDPEKAVGQKQLVESCPYGVIYWNEEKNVAQKCSFCVHRLEEGKQPRCVQACPAHALTFGDLDDENSDVFKAISSGNTDTFHPEYKTVPSVQYIELKRITSYFIAGAVVFADTDECAEGVKVTLTGSDGTMETETNNYGNFEFDGLVSGDYKLKFESAGRPEKSLDVSIEKETYIPDIML